MSSPYQKIGARLVERGYSCIPIMPGSKSPGELRRGEWRPMRDWGRFALRLPTRFDSMVFNTWPDAGAGLVAGPAGGSVVGIDIDVDDPAIKSAILSAIPPTTIIKRGAKGETRIFRGPGIVRSKSWHGIADLIGPGRQTVLPPTIHPDTKAAYVWIGPDTLENTNPDELPELTPAHIAAIDVALAPFGYSEEIVAPERGPSAFVCNDNRGREHSLGALRGCAGELAQAAPGCRNARLNAIAYKLGRKAARGWLSEDEIGEALWGACLSNGLLADDGPHAFRATFQSALRGGLLVPAPDPRERLTQIDPKFFAGLKPRPV